MKSTDVTSLIYLIICVIIYSLVGFELILVAMLAIAIVKLMEINVRLKIISEKSGALK